MIVAYDITGSASSQGSGVFITEDGVILTNAHVLKDAYSAEVFSSIGTFPHVTILLKDDVRDLALIRISARNALPVTFTQDTAFKPGQRVIAIGNPLGLEKTVSDGLISGIRLVKGKIELIQTTVPLSPGSSGGVLLNSSGELIGITTSTFEGGQNINFAISLNTIVSFLSEYNKNPGAASPLPLKPARESVWYRIVLKWIGLIIVVLLTALFGDRFYWAFPLLFFAIYIVYVAARGLWWLVSYPFRQRTGNGQGKKS